MKQNRLLLLAGLTLLCSCGHAPQESTDSSPVDPWVGSDATLSEYLAGIESYENASKSSFSYVESSGDSNVYTSSGFLPTIPNEELSLTFSNLLRPAGQPSGQTDSRFKELDVSGRGSLIYPSPDGKQEVVCSYHYDYWEGSYEFHYYFGGKDIAETCWFTDYLRFNAPLVLWLDNSRALIEGGGTLFDTRTGKTSKFNESNSDFYYSAYAPSPDGTKIGFITGEGLSFQNYDLKSGKWSTVASFSSLYEGLCGFAWSTKNRIYLEVEDGEDYHLYYSDPPYEQIQPYMPSAQLRGCSPSGSYLMIRDMREEKTVDYLLEPKSRKAYRISDILSAAWKSDTQVGCYSPDTAEILLADLKTGKVLDRAPLGELVGGDKKFYSLQYSGGRFLAVIYNEATYLYTTYTLTLNP